MDDDLSEYKSDCIRESYDKQLYDRGKEES